MDDSELIIDERRKIIRLTGEVCESKVNLLIDRLCYLQNLYNTIDDITLYINSYGGSYHSFIAAYDYIQNMECKVNTIGIGKCMSAGALFLLIGTGTRGSYKSTRIMLHDLQAGYPYQSLEDNAILHEEYQILRDNLVSIITKHTGTSEDIVRKDIKRDLFMSVEESLEYGIIDYII